MIHHMAHLLLCGTRAVLLCRAELPVSSPSQSPNQLQLGLKDDSG